MSTVDNRVVQMEFENKNFERNAKESMKTLKKLDDSLEFKNGAKSFKDVEDAAKALNFEPVKEAVNDVKKQFNALNAVATKIVYNITDAVTGSAKKMLKSLTIDPIMSGYSKYEEKTASVQTLMNSTGLSLDEINGYLSKLMWFSDETSYSFTQMTSALATMTSAGGDIATIVPMLQGVANATAFAGKGAREFSGAIFNLNQSYAGGFLSYMDYNSLDRTYNMFSKQLKEAFITSAKALGKLDKEGRTASGTLVDINNFSQTLSEKWADREVMESAFGWFNEVTEQAYALVQAGKYATASDAYEALAGQFEDVQYAAARSAQEAKTFQEAIDSTKDAVSSGWMATFESFFGNYEESKVLWTDLANSLYELFAEPGNRRNEIISEALTSNLDKFKQQIEDTGVSYDKFQDKLIEYGKTYGKITEEEIQNAESLEDVITSGWLSGDIVSEVLKGFTKAVNTKSVEERLIDANRISREILKGDWGNAGDRIRRLTEAGYDAAEVQKYANILYKKGKLAVEDLGEAVSEQTEITEEQAAAIADAASQIENFDELITGLSDPSGRDKLLQGVKNILSNMLPVLDSFKLAWGDVFGEISADNLKSFINNFLELSEKFKLSDETLQGLRDTFGGILAIVRFVIRIGKGLFKAFSPFFKLIAKMAGKVVRAFGKIGNAIKNALGGTVIEKIANGLYNVFSRVVSIIDHVNIIVSNFIEKIKERLPENNIFSRIGSAIQNIFSGSVFESITSFLDKIDQKLLGFITRSDYSGWLDKIGNAISEFNKKVSKLWKTVKTKLAPVFDKLKTIFQPIANFMKNSLVPAVAGFVKEIIESDHPLQTLWEKIKALFDPVDGLWKRLKKLTEKLNISKWFENWGKKFEDLRPKLEEFGKTIKEKLGNIDLTKIIAISAVTAMAALIANLNKALSGLTGLSGSIKTFFTQLTKAITPVKGKQFVQNVAAVTGAILLLAGAVYMLAQIEDKGSLWQAIGMIGVLAVVLGLLLAGITILSKRLTPDVILRMQSISKGLLAISGSLGIMSLALMLISQIEVDSWKQVGQILTLLAGAMAVLMITVIGISRFGKSMPLKSISVIAIAASLLLLAKALEKLNKLRIEGNGDFFDTMKDLLMSMFALALISRTTSFSGMLGVAGMIGALYLLMAALNKLKAFDFSSLANNSKSIAIVILSVVGLYALLSILGKYAASEHSAKTVIAIAASLLLVVGSVWLLGKVLLNFSKNADPTKVDKALNSFSYIVVSILAMMFVMGMASKVSGGNGGFVKLGAGLLLAVGAVAILSLVLRSLTKLVNENPDGTGKIWQALGMLAALTLMIDGMMIAAGFAAKLGGKTGMGYMITALAMMVAVIAGLYALQLIDPDTLRKTAVSMLIAMSAISLTLVAMAGAAKLAKGAATGMLVMLAMMVPLAAVVAALMILSTVPWQSIVAAGIALTAVMLAMSVAALIAKNSLMGGLALLALAPTIITVAKSLEILAGIPIKDLIKAAVALVVVTAAFGGMAIGLGAVAPLAIVGAVIMIALSAAMVIAAAGFLIFAAAIEKLNGTDLNAVADGLGQVAGPTMLLALAGILGIIGGPGLILLSIGMLALAGALAVIAGSAILASKALLFAKGAWDFLSGKGSESWNLAKQMTAEAEALETESNNLQQTIEDNTEKTTESIDNYGEETAKAYEEANAQIDAARNSGAQLAPIEDTPEVITTDGVKSSTVGTATDSDFLSKILGDFDVSAIGDKIKEYLGGADMLAGLQDSLGNLLGGLDLEQLKGNFDIGELFTGGINSPETIESLKGGASELFGSTSETAATSGQEAADAYVAAAAESMASNANKDLVGKSGTELVESASNNFASNLPDDSGQFFVSGIIRGIGKKANELYNYVDSVAKTCLEKLNIRWQVASPSRETAWSGMHFVNGLVVGIRQNEKYAVYAIDNLAKDTLTALNSALDGDTNEVISPVLDMSDAMTQINDLGNSEDWQPVIKPLLDMSDVDPNFKNLSAIATYRDPIGFKMEEPAAVAEDTQGVTFNQYNYSPKALSRLEIYRQTKNQLSMVKGVVNKS